MLENSVDAGATSVQLIVKDAGKTLIQVVDDGSGMSGTDARMSFERHATSKIKTSDGPAKKSIPTSPNTIFLAAVTKTLPGPTILSTFFTLLVP